MFNSWKNNLLTDQLNTISRLNNELKERVAFEHKLMDIIREYELVLGEYEKKFTVTPQEIYNSICVKSCRENDCAG